MPTVSNKRKGEAAPTHIINYITSDAFGDTNGMSAIVAGKQQGQLCRTFIG